MNAANTQHQRRWLVQKPAWFQAYLETKAPAAQDARRIQDWYSRPFGVTDPWKYLRVRNDARYGVSIAFKSPLENPERRAVCGGMLSNAAVDDEVIGPPHLMKVRHELDPLQRDSRIHLDVFEGAYAGLMILEWHNPPADADARLQKRFSQADLLEVTDSLTSAHIANLPGLDDADQNLAQTFQSIAKDVRMIVMTGPPGAGKSTFLKECAADPRMHVVPEVASILISQLGVRPFGEAGLSERFQIQLRNIQIAFEALARSEAQRKGCRAVVMDRGTLDAAAYLPHGTRDFTKLFNIYPDQEAQRYYGVIFLGLPPREVYERIRKNNPARSETYEQALKLEQGILGAWYSHTFRQEARALDWKTKCEQVREALRLMLD